MTEEDRQFWIILGTAVFFFGLMILLIVVGMVVRYRMEKPLRDIGVPQGPMRVEFLGTEVLREMRLGFEPVDPAGAVWVSRTPVTNSQYGWYVEEAGASRPVSFRDPGMRGGLRPVRVKSREEAAGFCRWLGERSGLKVRLAREGERRADMAPGAPAAGAPAEWSLESPEGAEAEVPRGFRCAVER